MKGELIFLVRIVVIDGDHLVQVVLRNPARQGHVLRHHAGSLAVSATVTGDASLTVLPIVDVRPGVTGRYRPSTQAGGARLATVALNIVQTLDYDCL